MHKETLWRRASMVITAGLMASFGITSAVAADATITDTGPHSRNRIDASLINNCDIRNTNDVSVNNTNRQTAATGDATVGGNTNHQHPWGGNGDWNGNSMWSPGGGNTNAGSATTGDASNWNNTETNVDISNTTDACQPKVVVVPKSHAVSPSVTHPTAAMAPVHHITSSAGGSGGVHSAAVAAPAPVAHNASVPAVVAASQPVQANVPAVPATPSASISNTGPSSSNTISAKVVNRTSVTNTNDVRISNNNYQTARSGDATVSGNTNAGSATTGDASNWNNTETTVEISN